MSDQNAIEFLDFCRNFDHVMLVTHSEIGMIARPMMIAEVDSLGNFWFATDVTSGKVEDINNNPDVCITMTGSPGNATVRGKATVIRDLSRIKSLWSETWRVWFPDGPTDAKLVLIKLDAVEGECWSTSGVQGWKYLFTMAKSSLPLNKDILNCSLGISGTGNIHEVIENPFANGLDSNQTVRLFAKLPQGKIPQ